MRAPTNNVKIILFTATLLTAGCQTHPVATSSQPAEQSANSAALAIPADQNAFILPYSPWGEQVQVVNIDRYTAASGRHCARLELAPPQNQTALVCQNPAGEWHPARQF
ncbi:DVU3141 family protein [Thiomicrospira microaerophila]|uniref:DVU3141 family protein n=1 Tax=Thiomicrospira microaerophila TaxID=406020 RepID=UPI0005C81DBB|nr:DVU3141 family protein [Thiomicrospira microaerophila]